ncbi:unnamed protein product [Rhizophagus irregularis]|nr:unnamed protein product [Rhizophagus irregularis]
MIVGGSGTIYKAILSTIDEDEEVILKYHNNLNDNLNEFLNEWKYPKSSYSIIDLYGFTKNPDTSKYMVVMEYANKGNLRENLMRIVKKNWNQKLYMLYEIITGLNQIHKNNLVHCDLHDGNILNYNDKVKEGIKADKIYISNLEPVKSSSKKDLMKKCWDKDPSKRPSSEEVSDIIKKWAYIPYKMNIEDINEELKCSVMEFINAPIGQTNFATESHSQAYYTSRLLDFTSKKLNEILDSQVINV